MSGKMTDPTTFKLGLFGYLHEGGNCFTTVPERWPADWASIERMARMADRGGLDFLIPIARWKGVPGAMMQRLHSFDTLTHAAALGAITEQIHIISTVHTPIIHPVVAAKAMTTIDHVTNGRCGLNIVCGWNVDDFEMFGLHPLPHKVRYAQAQEWYDIWSRLVAGAPEPFDYDGEHFEGLKRLSALPGSVQKPHPLVICAAASPEGRDFALRTSDVLFTLIDELDNGSAQIHQISEKAAEMGRSAPEVFAVSYVVCRPTRSEAEEFHAYYAEENADQGALDYYFKGRSGLASLPSEDQAKLRLRFAAGNGGYPLVGTPDDIVEQIVAMSEAGFGGASITVLNFEKDLPPIVNEILPALQKAGIRGNTASAA
ncbi:LLM class flavin-dependent oxidoreductase [Microbaculum marinum]|uniref:LLM class flavin-dependent oxidoreductase n=1 Tax=Microbaculum marinum TaxID=1764581 RepID=A0AAW9RSA8_9HYPH